MIVIDALSIAAGGGEHLSQMQLVQRQFASWLARLIWP